MFPEDVFALTRTAPMTEFVSPATHSSAMTRAPPHSTRPFRMASLPTAISPRTAPSRVPLLLPGEISARRRVFMIRGASDGYVAECCLSTAVTMSAACTRRWRACVAGSAACRRVDSTGGRS
jgi:hypothetical protein